MNADEEDVMFMDMKWTAILQLAQEDWEYKFFPYPILYLRSSVPPVRRLVRRSFSEGGSLGEIGSVVKFLQSGSGRDSLQHTPHHKSHRR